MGLLIGRRRRRRHISDPGAELQTMLPTVGEVCLLAESPFRILRVSNRLN